MSGIRTSRNSIGDFMPSLREGISQTGTGGGIQQAVTVPMGAPLLVDGTTYKGVAFVAPCNGCQIKELWYTAAVAMAGGTDTLAVSNYDKSASSARNALSTATVDPTGVTALKGTQLTLTSTGTDLLMDEGDVLNFTLVCGTMSTDGQGYALTAIVIVPDVV